jgi:gliding motility-associated-like protein
MKKLLLLFLNLAFFSVSAQTYLMNSNTGVTTCAGTFYDSGGAAGNYANNQSFTKTFCPATAGAGIQLNFSAFNLGSGDVMTIYNGNSIAAPAFGTYSGTDSPSVVQATTANPSGCITVTFTSDATGNSTGWAAGVSCVTPCQAINAVLNSTSPAQDADGVLRICQGESVTFNGSATFSDGGTGATYVWDFDNGLTGNGASATTVFADPGVYRVNLLVTDTNGCHNNNFLNIIVQVSTDPDFTGTVGPGQVCFGQPAALTGNVEAVPFNYECTPPVSGTTFLPDGSGVSYQTSVTVDCFSSGQTLTNINQLQNICLNMEHSYLGDLNITITSPSGQVAILKPYSGTGGGGGGTHLGHPWDPGSGADDLAAGPGIGLNYCFSMSGTAFLVNGPTIPSQNTPGSTVTPGTYLPTQSFASLLGSPLNGNWTITVTDNLASDNGYIFSWGLTFDPSLVPGDLSFTPQIVNEYWQGYEGQGSAISVTPATSGQHCYTYVAVDNFDCEYTETVCFEVLPEIVLGEPNDLYACPPAPASFDLTQNTPIILGALDPGTYEVTYHTTEASANGTYADLIDTADLAAFMSSGQTIYVRVEDVASPVFPACYETTEFDLIINDLPTVTDPEDVVACDEYILPELQNGDYYTGPDGTGTLLPSGSSITNTQTIYVYAESGTTPNCTAENSFLVTINESPVVDNPADVEVCECYVLPALTVGSYFTGPNGTGTALFAGDTVCATVANQAETIPVYIYAETGTVPNCTDESIFNVIIAPIEADDPADVVACDEYILPALTAESNYFTGPAGTGAPLFAGDIINSTQLIYVYAVSNANPNCTDENSFNVSIFLSPAAVTPTPLEVCDDNNDGFATFNLTLKTAEIMGSTPGLVVTYHETFVNADNGLSAIDPATAYQNVNQWTQTVYARVTNAGAPDCDTIVELVLIVNTRPVPNAIADYELCDYNNPGDGIEEFLLNTKTAEVTAGQPDLTVSYHATLGDAQAGTPSIDPDVPHANTPSGMQTIYVRIENDITGCSATTSFDLIVNPLPVPVAPEPLAACSDGVNNSQAVFDLTVKNNEILGAQAGFTVSYYNTLADAQNETGAIDPPNAYTGQQGEIVYVRMENADTGCYSTTQLELIVIEGPVANDPQPLEYCDPNNDGFGSFDLALAIPQIIGGAANVTVTFHETPQDAQFGTNAVGPLYSNINQWTQTIYVRVEANLAPCYDTVELQLIVNPTPEAATPDPIEVCDDDTDGIGTFDITIREADILAGADPALHTVTYHVTQANAIAGQNPITNVLAFNNTVPNTQTIWVRVTVDATGCSDTVPLVLIVNPLPVVPFPAPAYELCDVNNTGDEIEEFDLAGYAPNITAVPGMAVSYYLTQADAIAGTPALPSPYPNAVPGVQTIFVRVENTDTGCFAVTLLDLRVEPLPAPVVPEPVAECDADGNGFAQFDLDALVADILNGDPGTEVTFHETYDNADMDAFPLDSPYENINAFAQTIYIRAENTATGCYTVVAMQLEVKASPEMPDLDPIQICDNNQDGLHAVDLTQQTPVILAAQTGGSTYTVFYYASQAAAEAGTGAIVTPQAYPGANGQTVWVRVNDTATGCFAIGSFLLQIDTPLAVLPAYQLSLCDNVEPFQDNVATFDLTSMDQVITGGAAGYTVQYHLTLADAQSGNAIASPEAFSNGTIAGVNNPYTLFVTVTNDTTGCVSFTTLTIRVLPLPTPNTDPADLVACDNVDSPNGTEIFDLTANEAYIADGDPNLSFEYYDAAGNQIVDPTQYEGVGTVYIHVMNAQLDSDGENCYVVVEQLLIVNPLPVLNAGVVNAVCQQNNNGFATFTLSDSNAAVLGAGQDVAGFTFSYYLTLADAQSGTGALADQYQNVTNPQEIFVRVVNNETGCVNTIGVTLIADNGSVAGDPADITECDTDGTNDGFMEFDLTQLDAEIIGAQGPEYTLHYYDDYDAMQADIAEGPTTDYSGAIADPAAYTNAAPFSQTIYGLVLNTDSVTGCPAIAEILITVNPLPEPVITDDSNGIICVDFETDVATPVTLTTNYGTDPGYAYEWTLGGTVVGTDPTYTITSIDADTATYGVTVTNIATGCVSDPVVTHLITRSGPAVVTDIQVTNAFTDSQTITVIAEGYGQYEYSLDGGPWQSENVFYGVPLGVSAGGEHSVRVRDALGGCGPFAEEPAFLIGYPNYFTPNGDGIHDTWNIVGLIDQPNAKIYIFDRYGKLIKQISPSGEGWDGTMNGSPLPSTDYWFRVEFEEQGKAKEFRAHFSLKR